VIDWAKGAPEVPQVMESEPLVVVELEPLARGATGVEEKAALELEVGSTPYLALPE